MKIMNYKPINKGSLLGSFDLTVTLDKTHEGAEMILHDCKLFEKNGQRWVGFPSRPYQSKEGETKYAPYVSVQQKEFKSKIDAECLRQLEPMMTVTEVNKQVVDDSSDIPF